MPWEETILNNGMIVYMVKEDIQLMDGNHWGFSQTTSCDEWLKPQPFFEPSIHDLPARLIVLREQAGMSWQ